MKYISISTDTSTMYYYLGSYTLPYGQLSSLVLDGLWNNNEQLCSLRTPEGVNEKATHITSCTSTFIINHILINVSCI